MCVQKLDGMHISVCDVCLCKVCGRCSMSLCVLSVVCAHNSNPGLDLSRMKRIGGPSPLIRR